MNQENMENGEFDNQGIENSYNNANSAPNIGFPRVNPLNNVRNSPVFGINRNNNIDNNAPNSDNSGAPMPGGKKDDGKPEESMPGSKKDNGNPNNNNMPGMKKNDSDSNNNAMPGMKKNDSKNKDNKSNNTNNKNSANKNNANDKNKSSNIKKPGERRNFNPLSRLNPLNRIGLGRSASGGSSSSSSSSGSNGSGNKLVSLFMKLPLVVKVKVVVTASVITILAVAFFLIISVLGGTTAAIVAATCGATSYDIGSADATLFLKSMDDPMGDASYEVTSIYGWRNCDYHGHEFHPAVDLAGPSGTSIHAVSDGVISEIGSNGSFGNSITINHNETFYTMYNHLSGFKSGLKKGDTVKQGDIIGYEGSTGTSTGAHLDFRLFDKDKNPISINAYFGYSDKGYESCVNPNEKQPASECDLGSTGSARKLGSDGFTEIANKTNEFTDSSCCSSYSSSVSVGEVSGLPKILTQEFVNGAVQSQSKYGVPASLTLAQLVLESGGEYEGGVSELAYKCKNLFGIKGKGTAGVCFYNTGEQTASGSSFSIVAGFRKYNTYAESIEDHAKVLTSDWYKRCTKDAKTADDWARAIKKCGYATDVSYANKIISIMKEYNLYQYDDSSVFGSGSGSCDTGETGDIVDKANDEYDKWNKASSSERTEMLKNYMEACGLGRTCNHWCSGFVSYILKETGRLNNLKNFNCMADSYTKVEPATHHKQGSGYTPKAGDIIVFDYTGNGSGDHVAIVESVKGKTIHYIGGNQTSSNSASCWSNAITKVTVPLDSKNILDFVTIG